MILYDTAEKPPAAFLVYAADTQQQELKELIKNIGMTEAGNIRLANMTPAVRYGIGTGKAEEIKTLAGNCGADCIVFDFPLSATHQRNWEQLTHIPVFDRQEVILRIFALRAMTKEAVLQTELAKLLYSLPRLAHMYGDMARQRGGNYGSKGSGESQLELDRRTLKERIVRLRKELGQVAKERGTQRKKRSRVQPPSCALVGYTNAGKSSLLNALTGSEVPAENKLFATLDPSTRKMPLGNGSSLLITDTVGFIRSLPHTLIDAFKSTLEEALHAELLLIVLDAADPEVSVHLKTVLQVLSEIGAADKQPLIVLNKTDAADAVPFRATVPSGYEYVRTSCISGQGLGTLKEKICQILYGKVYTVSLPLSEAHIIKTIRNTGIIYKEEWETDSVFIKARVRGQTLALIKPYLLH